VPLSPVAIKFKLKTPPRFKVRGRNGCNSRRSAFPQFDVVITRFAVAFARIRSELFHLQEAFDPRGQIQSIEMEVSSPLSKRLSRQMLQSGQGGVDAGMHEDENGTVRGSHNDFRVSLSFGIEDDAASGLIADERCGQRVVSVVDQTPHTHGTAGADGGHVIPSWMKGGVEHGEGLQSTADLLGGERRGARVDGAKDAEDGSVHDGPQEQQTIVAAGEHEGSVGGKSTHVNVILVAMIFAVNGALAVMDTDGVDVPGGDGGVSRARDQPGVGGPSAHGGSTRGLVKGLEGFQQISIILTVPNLEDTISSG